MTDKEAKKELLDKAKNKLLPIYISKAPFSIDVSKTIVKLYKKQKYSVDELVQNTIKNNLRRFSI